MSKTSLIILALLLVVLGACLNRDVKAQGGVILNREQLAAWIPDYATQTQIVLSYKGISSIDTHTFDGLSHITNLLLYSNQLTNLMPGTFDSLINLEGLDLGFNTKLTQLDSRLFKNLNNLCRCLTGFNY